MKLNKDSIKKITNEVFQECVYWNGVANSLDEVALCVYLERLNFTFQPGNQSQNTLVAEMQKK